MQRKQKQVESQHLLQSLMEWEELPKKEEYIKSLEREIEQKLQ